MRPFLVALVLLLAGCAGQGGEPAASGSAPTWSFTDLDGMVHSRDAPPGNATVLFFMATWCTSCRGKAPMISEVHGDYAARGVRFYSIDVDPTERVESIRAWQRERDQPWPHGVDAGASVQRAFGVTSQSSVVVLDGSGAVGRSWGYGAVTEEGLRAALDEALRTTAAPAARMAPTTNGAAGLT